MRSSELLIIYLAIAAPRGVALFLQRSSGEHVFKRAVKAFGASLLWPLSWRRHVAFARNRNRPLLTSAATEEQDADEAISIKIESATHILLASFNEVYKSSQAFQDEQQRALAVYECRRIVETYVGLTRLLAATTALFPSARETEIARLGGRRGDDLQLAGICIQRRNAARLFAHTQSVRANFLELLSDLQSYIPKVYSNSLTDKREAEGALSENILRVYGYAINLASLLEDTETTLCTAKLLDAECACLRALGAGDVTKESELPSSGEKTCLTTHAARTSSTGRLPNKTFTQA